MSLIDDLRKAADALPPSHKPTVNEVIDLLGAWIAYAEHGVEFLHAAEQGQQAVADLFASKQTAEAAAAEPVAEPAPEPAAPAEAPSVAELEAENAALKAQLAAAQGAINHPVVETAPAPSEVAA